MDADHNIYRNRKSQRASWWNYSNNGTYFVTINCLLKHHYFGKINQQELRYSHQGIIAHLCLDRLPYHYTFISIDSFIIMPNHVHSVLTIKEEEAISKPKNNTTSLSSIIGNFKAAVTRYCNLFHLPFAWQRSFHDKIIRNPFEYEAITNYILNNPKNWSP